MIGAGTQDLARGLVELAERVAASSGRPALRVCDAEGRELACGGDAALDAGIAVEVSDGEIALRGVSHGRIAEVRPVCLRDRVELIVVATNDSGEDRATLVDLSDLASGLLERERLRDYEAEDTTEHLLTCFEQIRAVHDLADKLPACESVEDMGKLCLGSLNTALGVRQSALVLVDPGAERGRALRIADGGARMWMSEVDLGPGPIRDAIADSKVRYGVASSYEFSDDSIEADAEHVLMVVPISFGAEQASALGALVLLDRDEEGPGRAFGSPDADLAQSVSTLLGLALGTRARAAAEKELQIARAIQETLIPANAPSWESLDVAGRNRAANQVGGDYFDFMESADGRQHCVIADVSGHNMASAMAMVMARSQLRMVVPREASPSRIFGALASGLYEDLVRNELFITAFFLSVVERDPERGTRIRYTNAGHNPPLVLREGGTVEWLEGGGPMIGFMPNVDYDEQEVWLRPGDLLVLYTDGVTEATDANGEMLDEDGLAEVVTRLQQRDASTILDGIYRTVEEHAEHRVADDDVTVVVIKSSALKELPTREPVATT